jgi:hypothetical protein
MSTRLLPSVPIAFVSSVALIAVIVGLLVPQAVQAQAFGEGCWDGEIR